MSHQREFGGGGQYRSNSGHVSGYYDSRTRNRDASSRSSDYITRPAAARSVSDSISIWVQPDEATYKIRLDNSDSGYAGSGSDYMNRPEEPKDDHISPYAHDQGFVSNRRSIQENREVHHPSQTQQHIHPSRPEYTRVRHTTDNIRRYEKRSRGHDGDVQHPRESDPIYSFGGKTTQERPSVDRSASYEDQSDYRIYTDGWGSKHNFMRSHGIKPGELGSYEEADELLDKYREFDARYTREHGPHDDHQPSTSFTSRAVSEKRASDCSRSHEGKSNYRIMKDGWGDMHTFMRSHGLKPGDADDYAEANELLHKYGDLDAQYAKDNRQEPRESSKRSGHKRHDSRNYSQPHQYDPPDLHDNESDFSYQSGETQNRSSARGFSVVDSDFSSPSPPRRRHTSHRERNPQNYAASHTILPTPPSPPSLPSFPRGIDAYPPLIAPETFVNPHAGFSYTRAMRQHRSSGSLRRPHYSNPMHSGFMPPPTYHGRGAHSYAGSDIVSDGIRDGSDDESINSGVMGGSGFMSGDGGSASGVMSGGSAYFSHSEGARSDVLSGRGSRSGSEYMSDTAVEHDEDYDEEYDEFYDD